MAALDRFFGYVLAMERGDESLKRGVQFYICVRCGAITVVAVFWPSRILLKSGDAFIISHNSYHDALARAIRRIHASEEEIRTQASPAH